MSMFGFLMIKQVPFFSFVFRYSMSLSKLVGWGAVVGGAVAVGFASGVWWLSAAAFVGAVRGSGSWDERNSPQTKAVSGDWSCLGTRAADGART